jgi:hypothetical protein
MTGRKDKSFYLDIEYLGTKVRAFKAFSSAKKSSKIKIALLFPKSKIII